MGFQIIVAGFMKTVFPDLAHSDVFSLFVEFKRVFCFRLEQLWLVGRVKLYWFTFCRAFYRVVIFL